MSYTNNGIFLRKNMIKFNLQYIIIFLLLLLKISWGKFPVILIPGDGGSQLEAKLNKTLVPHYVCTKVTSDYFSLWLNLELLVPVVIDCWIDNIMLVYDNVTRTTQNTPGVDIRVPGFGNSSVVEYIDPTQISTGGYFYKIGAQFLTIGYERDISLRGAPYDFRKAPNEHDLFFNQFKILIEETFVMNGNSKVILLGHSMGALMILEFLHRQNQAWKDKYIRALVTLAGAWGGSVKAIKAFAVGDNLGVFVLSASVLRTEQITCPSLAWLLPSSLFWKPNEILVETDTKNYSLSNLNEFFNAIDYMTGWEMFQDVKKYGEDFRAPGVELFCLHGYGVKTVEKMVYSKGAFPAGSPTMIMGDGDGTVNRRSLEACLQWTNQQKQKIHHQVFLNIDHMSILTDKGVLQYLLQLFKSLKNDTHFS